MPATGALLCSRARATSHSAVSGAEREEQSRNVDQRRPRSEPRRERSPRRLHWRGFSLTLFANPWRLQTELVTVAGCWLVWPHWGSSQPRWSQLHSPGCLCRCSCPDLSERAAHSSSYNKDSGLRTQNKNSLYTLKNKYIVLSKYFWVQFIK